MIKFKNDVIAGLGIDARRAIVREQAVKILRKAADQLASGAEGKIPVSVSPAGNSYGADNIYLSFDNELFVGDFDVADIGDIIQFLESGQ